MIPSVAQLAQYRKFLVTVANLLAVVLGLGLLHGTPLAVVLGAVAVLNAAGVYAVSNNVILPDPSSGAQHRVVKV